MTAQRKGGIAWTDQTWNPVRGCSRVSEGCRNCYAESVAARFSGPGQPYEGLATRSPARWTGVVRLVEEHLVDPLRWTRPRRVFVNSMSDLFHESLPDEAIDRVFAVMALSPQHTFQVLTKRPERMRDYLSHTRGETNVLKRIMAAAKAMPRSARRSAPASLFPAWPLPNVWLGTSIENQPTADERLPHVLATPAAVRFVSYEPALGPVDFGRYFARMDANWDRLAQTLDWVIVGGESGPGARPFDVAWARSTIAQCRAAGVAVFCKQLGARCMTDDGSPVCAGGDWPDGVRAHVGDTMSAPRWVQFRDRKGADPSEWPEALRVREFPHPLAARGGEG